jgi:hypothetical protein
MNVRFLNVFIIHINFLFNVLTSIYLSIFAITPLFAQTTLKGTVLDAKTREPVAFASVYLEGTTIGTSTDSEGQFSLTLPDIIYTRLIVSIIGYESIIITNPFESLPEIICLEEKEHNLNEVIVTGSKPTFTEKQKMNAFREQLLGMTKAGNSCKILNEDSVRLIYDPEKRELRGYAGVPLEIENRYLGYRIHWELVEFTLRLGNRKSLNDNNINSVIISGIPLFEELGKNSVFYDVRRIDTYHYSLKRFFKLLADEKIEDSDFDIFDNFGVGSTPKLVKVNHLLASIIKSPENSSTTIILNPEKKKDTGLIAVGVANTVENPAKNALRSITELRSNTVYYNSTTFSIFYFTVDTVNIDKYGNTDLSYTKGLRLSGAMGKQRIGDMLPLDYLPPSWSEL